jgi:hypothetical protein
METFVESIEATESAISTSVATEQEQTTMESSAPKKEISKMAIWARAHKGIIEIVDPELMAQLSYYRRMDKQLQSV